MKPIFVQIKCELTKAMEVAAWLVDNIEETCEVYSTSGTFDLLVKFELADEQSFGDFVTSKVQRVPGVRDTYSIVAFQLQWSPKARPNLEPRPEPLRKSGG